MKKYEFKETGKDYDFIATMNNNTNKTMKLFIENEEQVATLLLETYDDKNNFVVIEFSVSSSWLEKHIDSSIEDFLNEYTSTESESLYALAILDKAIIARRFSF